MRPKCFNCDTRLKSLTGACPGCGSIYRRGELVEERNIVRKRVPIRAMAALPKPEKRINFDTLPWKSWQRGATRDEAVEAMYRFYDEHPGNRRKAARDAVEVTYADVARYKGEPAGLWILTVQWKKRNNGGKT